MWNDRKSLILSKCFVALFMVLLLVSAVLSPSVFQARISYMPNTRTLFFKATVYLGCVPAALLLIQLYMLLHRIGEGLVFINKNTECLRYISWCCFAGAAISLVSALYWFPWCAVGVAAAFMGLIVRVIKNVVAKAVSLQDDADHTI